MQILLRHLILFVFALVFHSKIQAQAMDSTQIAQLRKRALELDQVVSSDLKYQTNNFNSSDSTSLPVGIVKEISGVKYIICIDSARYTANGASFDVYMAVDFPGTAGKLAFAAKGIPFDKEGVKIGQGDVTLKLIGDQTLNLGPKNKIVFKGDGSNYIQWNCDGYQQAHINADIHFSKDLIHTPDDKVVIANLQANVYDLKNILFETTIAPFEVTGLDDFVFTITNLAIDRNENANPINCTLPLAYEPLYIDDENWMGFYAASISLTLPESFNSGGSATIIGVNKLFIDDNGVTGEFFAGNIFTVSQGDMSSWKFSLDSVKLGLAFNQVVRSSFKGSVIVPDLNNANFGYRASMYRTSPSQNYSYDFTVLVNEAMTYNLPSFKSTLKLNPGTQFNVHLANNKFTPSMKLNGKLSLDDPKVKLSELSFQNLNLISVSPFITSGTFALSNNNDTNQMASLPISITSIGLGISNSNVVLNTQLLLSLGGKESSNSFSANAGFNLITKRQNNPSTSRQELVFDKITVSDINLSVNTQPFKLQGVIALREDDPTFGRLFFGSIAFKVNNDKIMPDWAMVSAGFGKLNGNKYWYADAAVPVNIPIGAVLITNLFGGASYGVKSNLTPVQKMDRAFNGAISNSNGGASPNMNIPFIPDTTLGLGFNAGVAMISASGESVFNAEAIFGIQFNASGGFLSVGLDGRSYFMTKRTERNSTTTFKGSGVLSASYNHNARVLHATLDVTLSAPNVLYGVSNVTLHVDTTNWYFWLNRPSNRAEVNVVNVFQANAYFMIGTQIDPMPPPPAYVLNLVSSSPIISTNTSQVSSGQGFATGMQIGISVDEEFPKTTQWRGYVACGIGGGFDVTLFKLIQGTHCVNETTPAGMNGWYCNGQVYVWLNGALGARKYNEEGKLKNEYNVCSINAAALLQGRLPKPSFVYGTIGFNVSILSIIDFSFDADFQFGNDCTLI